MCLVLVFSFFLSLFTQLSLGNPSQVETFRSDSSEVELSGLLNDISKLLNVDKEVPPGPIDEEVTFICSNGTKGLYRKVTLNDDEVFFKLDFQQPIAFIVHGWNGDFREELFRDLVQSYERFVGGNVCQVDWAGLSSYDYSQIAYDLSLRVVVNYFSRFLRFLNLNGMDYDVMTLVGHSLGAQVCGFVGKKLGGQLGQIFALDPAGVLFTLPEDVGEENRLAPTDAQYVQAIYTSSGTMAMSVGAGQQNFWLNNNGLHPQPGCEDVAADEAVPTYLSVSLICSHEMAVVYFTAALDPESNYEMTRCSAYWMYTVGICTFGTTDKIGFHAEGISGDFYGAMELSYNYSRYFSH